MFYGNYWNEKNVYIYNLKNRAVIVDFCASKHIRTWQKKSLTHALAHTLYFIEKKEKSIANIENMTLRMCKNADKTWNYWIQK